VAEVAVVMAVVPSSVRIELGVSGWAMTAVVPLEGGGEGVVKMRLREPVLTVEALVRRAAHPKDVVLPEAVPHGTWLSGYSLHLNADGDPAEDGGVMSMHMAGKVVGDGTA
jgi:hypothetical protein